MFLRLGILDDGTSARVAVQSSRRQILMLIYHGIDALEERIVELEEVGCLFRCPKIGYVRDVFLTLSWPEFNLRDNAI